jgi:hypothetical protein
MPIYRREMMGVLFVTFYEYTEKIGYYLFLSNIDYMFSLKMTSKQTTCSTVSFEQLFIREISDGLKIVNKSNYSECYLTP